MRRTRGRKIIRRDPDQVSEITAVEFFSGFAVEKYRADAAAPADQARDVVALHIADRTVAGACATAGADHVPQRHAVFSEQRFFLAITQGFSSGE